MSAKMKISVWCIVACVIQVSAHAADVDQATANTELKTLSGGQPSVRPTSVENLPMLKSDHRVTMGATRHANQIEQSADFRARESAFALAISRAAKKGVIELGVEASAEVLIQCQKAQSVVLTTSFLRSDSQQAHCYRF